MAGVITPSLLASETQRMLFDLLETSGNRAGVAALLQMLGGVVEHTDYMRGPVAVMTVEPPASTPHPDWLVRAVERARLQSIIEESASGVIGLWATPAEVFAYLYPALRAAQDDWPLPDDWTRILLWARHHTLCRYAELAGEAEDYRANIDPDDEAPYITPTGADQQNFRHLAHLIRSHVVACTAGRRLRTTPPPPYNDPAQLIYPLDHRYSFEALFRTPDDETQLMEGIRPDASVVY